MGRPTSNNFHLLFFFETVVAKEAAEIGESVGTDDYRLSRVVPRSCVRSSTQSDIITPAGQTLMLQNSVTSKSQMSRSFASPLVISASQARPSKNCWTTSEVASDEDKGTDVKAS